MVEFPNRTQENFRVNQPEPPQPVDLQQAAPLMHRAIEIANSEPVFSIPEMVSQTLNRISDGFIDTFNLENFDVKKGVINFFNFLSGAAVGALSGIAIVGVSTSPVGWVLAVGALVLTLSAAYRHGGKEDVLHALKYAGAGFLFAGGISMMGTADAVGHVAGMSIAESGYGGYFLSGPLIMMVGQIIGMCCAIIDTGAFKKE